jgi:hypothetical protein
MHKIAKDYSCHSADLHVWFQTFWSDPLPCFVIVCDPQCKTCMQLLLYTTIILYYGRRVTDNRIYKLPYTSTDRAFENPSKYHKVFPQFCLVGKSICSFFFGIVWFSSITKTCLCMSKDSLTDRGCNYFSSKLASKWKRECRATKCLTTSPVSLQTTSN